MKTRIRDSRKGFTLIELLIVVVIIGILAAIAIPKFSSTRQKAFRSAMLSDLKNLASVQEIYHTDNFTYAGDLAVLGAVESEGVTLTINESSNTGWSASATHLGAVGESCAIFQGSAAPVAPATIEGLSACTF
ncbi:MAG: prepilin-type N-terminal cleavage/methylation domain-containing protein [Longimicrobiales bacterium]|nr:prepilin-type N-terminal cleavage/methylation domain-containing protein [Longimicrobiales bacterium]